MSDALSRLDDLSPVKRALLAKHLRASTGATQILAAEPIAIIGVGCRFPGGVHDPESFWDFLTSGGDGITEIGIDRWDVESFYNPDPDCPGTMSTRWSGLLQHIDRFDAEFFGISPREASSMDPQQRLFLEVAWEALERAGQPADKLAGTQTGVFVGVCSSEYGNELDLTQLDAYTGTGTASNIIAGRLSYLLDLRGPSVAIDTACSSSLVAVHMACQSLRMGESNMVIAGGVNLILSPRGTVNASRLHVMAQDGRCKTFDASADGFVRGEGCGVIVLKRLSDAIAAGDPVLALIYGSAVNQDGRSAGLTAPNVLAQQAVVQAALTQARLAPQTIGYVETHGTGTALGDPIEVEALAAVLDAPAQTRPPCFLGALKTNIGHLEAAAGIAGLIKVVLCLQHQAIPPNLHLRQLNPNIPLAATRFQLPTQLTPWPAGSQPRFAGVSSFGWSGTNAHVVLGEAPRTDTPAATAQLGDPERSWVLPLSARSSAALRALAQSYATLLETTSAPLAAICATASLRRTHHSHRLAAVGNSPQAMAEQLRAWAEDQPAPNVVTGLAPTRRPRLAFAFPGQGSQWRGMGRQLLHADPTFRSTIEACAAALAPHTDWSLLDQLAGRGPDRLDELGVIQPVLWAMQVALAAVWQERGLRPDVVIGHSMGEVAAATVAGMLPLAEAARLIARRSRLLQQLVGRGAMALVELPVAEATALLAPWADEVAVAVCNSPRSCVLAGAPGPLAELLAQVSERGVFWRYVKVDVASHSPQVDPILPALATELGVLDTAVGQVPLRSTVSGKRLRGPELTASYWVDNLRQPVQFWDAVATEAADGSLVLLEVSPHPILAPLVAQGMAETKLVGSALGTLRREQDELGAFALSLAELYVAGVPLAWERLVPTATPPVDLPTYPWQRERFWLPSPRVATPASSQATALREGLDGSYSWETSLDLDTTPYLADHQVAGTPIVPAAWYLAAIQNLGEAVTPGEPLVLGDIALTQMLILGTAAQRVQVLLGAETDERRTVVVASRAATSGKGTAWTRHISGQVAPAREAPPAQRLPLADIQARLGAPQPREAHYAALAAVGLDYGPNFQGIAQVWASTGEVLAQLNRIDGLPDDQFALHPAFFDACLQALALTTTIDSASNTISAQPLKPPSVPTHIDTLIIRGPVPPKAWSYARVREDHGQYFIGDVVIADEQGKILIEVMGMGVQYLEAAAQRGALGDPEEWLYQVAWTEQPRLPVPLEPAQSSGQHWLIFADAHCGDSLAALLQAQDCTVTLVYPGVAFERIDTHQYRVNPASAEDIRAVLGATIGAHAPCQGIVHLWSLDSAAPSPDTDALEEAMHLGCGSVMHMLQALSAESASPAPRLWLVTQGAQIVDQAERPSILQSPLWGFGRAVAEEYPLLWGGLIDLDPNVSALDNATLVWETVMRPAPDHEHAYRDGRRFVPRLRHSRVDLAKVQALDLSPNASYLVTGGLGDLGLQIARWMAERGAKHLVLMGRTALPPRNAWHTLAADSRAMQQVQTIHDLEAAGVAVHLAVADVANVEQLTAALCAVNQAGLPPIRGVIHAAGVIHQQPLSELTLATLRDDFRPKVQGSWALHRTLADQPLDFMVFFSSGSALLSPAFLSSYAAANTFLDSFAHYRRGLGLPALSINWGFWSDVGMAARRNQHPEHTLTPRGMGSFTPAEGLDVMQRLMQQELTQIAVMPVNWREWVRYHPSARNAPFLEHVVAAAQVEQPEPHTTRSQLSRTALLQADAADVPQLLESYLRSLVARVLRQSEAKLKADQPLTAFGMDSLMALEMKNGIETDLGLTVSVVYILQGPSITQFVALLNDQVLAARLLAAPVSSQATAEQEWEELEL